MSSQIVLPPSPDLSAADKQTLAVAKYLRHSEIIKQRPALLGGQRWDMFRIKRAVRALLDPAYSKARAKNPFLPEIANHRAALETLAKFPHEKFALNVMKLETEDALAQGFKPKSGVPVVLIPPNQTIGDDEYMIWTYNPIPMTTYLYGAGLLVGGVSIALYQLWPVWAQKASYYFSMLCMGLVGAVIVIGVVRLVIFLITALSMPRGFWLFPNLFADVGILESFRPFWAWSGDRTLPVKPKLKKRKPKANSNKTKPVVAAAGPSGAKGPGGMPVGPGGIPGGIPGGPGGPGRPIPPGAIPMLMRQTPNGPVPVGPLPPGVVPAGPDRPGQFMMHPALQLIMNIAVKRADKRLEEVIKTSPPKSKEEFDALRQNLIKEEAAKAQEEFKVQQAFLEAQAQAKRNN